MNAYGTSDIRSNNNAYGTMAGNNAAAATSTTRADIGGLLQSGVSSSALVNSG